MITAADYFAAYAGHDEITPAIEANADELLRRVNSLLEACIMLGWSPMVNPSTGTLISGQKNGGWRPQACPIGAPNSSHKQGAGVDVADGSGKLDTLITDDLLAEYDLFRESPEATPGWVHLTTRAPKSGRRTFYP